MFLLASLLATVLNAHQLMLTFNCDGIAGMGRTVQNVPDDCLTGRFIQSSLQAHQLSQLDKTASVAKSYGMQYLSGSDNLDTLVIEDLAELDQKLSELIKKGEKVVLLGDQVNIEPRLVSKSNGDQAVQRKPLAVDDKPTGWMGYPEKSFKDCGLIKIEPNFYLGDTKYTIDSDTSKWSCAKDTSGYASFILPVGETNLKISFEKSSEIGSYDQYLNMLFTFNSDVYNTNQSLPYSTNAPGSWSYTCNSRQATNADKILSIGAYQVQADSAQFANGQFGMAIDCTPLFGEMVWVTLIGFILLTLIMAAALAAVLAIETPTKFETPRSKPLIIPDAQ